MMTEELTKCSDMSVWAGGPGCSSLCPVLGWKQEMGVAGAALRQ